MEDIFLPLHLLTLAFIAWNVFRADHLGLSWMRGKVMVLDKVKVEKYHKNIWIGLGLMIFTGLFLFWPLSEYLLTRPQFYVKMWFVGVLIINGIAIGRLNKVAQVKAFSALTSKEKLPLLISGAISTLGWLGAALGGLFLLS
jgi:hypothetical protein